MLTGKKVDQYKCQIKYDQSILHTIINSGYISFKKAVFWERFAWKMLIFLDCWTLKLKICYCSSYFNFWKNLWKILWTHFPQAFG